MMRHTPWVAVAAMILGFAACSNPVTSHKAWDDYAGETLKVHGADRATAGQVVWRAVKEHGGIRDFLAAQGEPDALEIRGGKFSQKTIILYYTRRSAGAPHRIRLDPGKHGFTPRAPELITTGGTAKPVTGASPRPQVRHGGEPPLQPEWTPKPAPARTQILAPPPVQAPPPVLAPAPLPTSDTSGGHEPRSPQTQPTTGRSGATTDQRVNCPIDPTRWDCRALCSPGADYEWCR
ncbi:MAG: hypothetical protein HY271_05050 [Deltaproteobacteria bacterium]|nr:hypothetical protein [Deltaproteobacteria bacterium]